MATPTSSLPTLWAATAPQLCRPIARTLTSQILLPYGFTPHPIPVHGDKQSKLTLMSESLRNDGRIWVPKKLEDAKKLQRGEIKGRDIPEEDRDYYLERRYPAFGNLVPATLPLVPLRSVPTMASA